MRQVEVRLSRKLDYGFVGYVKDFKVYFQVNEKFIKNFKQGLGDMIWFVFYKDYFSCFMKYGLKRD